MLYSRTAISLPKRDGREKCKKRRSKTANEQDVLEFPDVPEFPGKRQVNDLFCPL
jgi:hypothetical protein